MSLMFRCLDAVSNLLFRLACLFIVAIVLIVTYDVLSRNFGLPMFIWAVNSVEYAMLYVTFLCLPYLVMTRGHVSVEVVLTYLPKNVRKAWEFMLHIIAALICFYLAWYSGKSFVTSVIEGTYEVRSFDAPMWALYVTMPLGFGFGGAQFLSFIARGESFFGAAPEAHAGM